MPFTHFDERGEAIMVDVGGKDNAERRAVAAGRIKMSVECFEAVKSGKAKKGDVLGVARIAGIMAAKRAPELIPLCHTLLLTGAGVEFELLGQSLEIEVLCTVTTRGRTGVEMEALTGVSAALLTIYDMCKAMDRSMEMGSIRLIEKSGGKSGDFRSKEPTRRESGR